MPSSTILHEAEQLKHVSQRLELTADEHPSVTDAILTICGTIRSTATLWKCWWLHDWVALRHNRVCFIEQTPLAHLCTVRWKYSE